MSVFSLLAVTLSSTTTLLGRPLPEPPPQPGVHFVAVGQGAAALLIGRGVSALIDVGPSSGAEAVLHALAVHGIDRLDLLIATHFDADHIGGLGPILAGPDGRQGTADDIELGLVWDRGLEAPLPASDAMGLYLSLVEGHRLAPGPGAVFDAGGVHIELLGPAPEAPRDENERSLVSCVELGGLRMLAPGDAPAAHVEAAATACGPVDILWASHHGAADGSSPAAIEGADPRVTVISAGHANAHCHPSSLALAHLRDRALFVLDGAGLWPSEACSSVAEALDPDHHQLIGHDLYVDPELRAWAAAGSAWAPLN